MFYICRSIHPASVCFNIQSLFRNNPIPWAFRKIWNGFRGNLKWMEGIPFLHTIAKPAFHMLTVAFPLIYSVERMIRPSKGYSTDRGFPGGASGKETSCQCGRHKTLVRSMGRKDLEEEMATHSSILAWRIPKDRGTWWATVHGVQRVGQLSTYTQCWDAVSPFLTPSK